MPHPAQAYFTARRRVFQRDGALPPSGRPRSERIACDQPDRLATWLRLDGTYPTPDGPVSYRVRGVPWGFGLMFVAAVLVLIGGIVYLLGHGGHV